MNYDVEEIVDRWRRKFGFTIMLGFIAFCIQFAIYCLLTLFTKENPIYFFLGTICGATTLCILQWLMKMEDKNERQ
jgi:Kef-type K+ transport system membrane component KefB